MDKRKAYETLTKLSAELLRGCEKTAPDGTVLFTPDGVGNYDALWVRDFAYMTEYVGDLMGEKAIGDCIRFILRGQRADGWFPDRVEASGETVYAAGAKGSPVGLANLDNTPFLVFAVSAYFEMIGKKRAQPLFRVWCAALDRGMACIPLSEEGLVYNDAAAPHSPYGFTDTVCKTGRLFMESVLFWRAAKQMARLYDTLLQKEEAAAAYERKARCVEENIHKLWDAQAEAFFAADGDCRQHDVWGMLYAWAIGFPMEESLRSGMTAWLLCNRERYMYRGQIYQLLDGAAWEKLLIDIPAGEYQNGAYWATASGWALELLDRCDPPYAAHMLNELLTDIEENGICECINENYRKLPQFVVSAVNVRGALRRILLAEGGLTC